jgi:thiol-disulfide isomerase/thioredoxin
LAIENPYFPAEKRLMSTQKKPGAFKQIIAGFAVLAGITGIYLFQGDARKAGTAEAEAVATAPAGVTRDLATGALAAFLVRLERKPVTDVAFQDGEGKPLKLSDWKGRVVLINLWATWCAPCRKEMPDLAELQKGLGGQDFEVVAISVDRKGVEASAAFLKETGADNLKLYIEPTTAIVNDLQAIGLPATVLLDRQGNEIGRLLGPADWASPEAKALIKAALAEGT